MKRKPWILLALLLGLSAAAPSPGHPIESAAPGVQAAQPAAAVVPADLNALLVPKLNGMRIIIQRYEADRYQLGRFSSVVSPARFSRLKRFDLDWAAALEALKAAASGAAEQADLQALGDTVQANLKRLDADAAESAQIAPLVPFAEDIARLEEDRARMASMDAEKAALTLERVLERAGTVRADLEAALADPAKLAAMLPGQDLAVRAAESVKNLRAALRRWFEFYNDYDPLFTWWMAQPYKQSGKTLEEYEVLLRDKAAPAIQQAAALAPPPVEVVAAPAPPFPAVPDLHALLGAPQDEMRGIVQRFRGGAGRGPAGLTALSKESLSQWLRALKSLDFDKLSRSGQISYLYLRHAVEMQLRSAGRPAPAGPPRKADASGIGGRAIGRDALIQSLAEELIPYTPEQLIVLAERQYAWCEEEMKKASREMGFGDDWKAALEKVKGMHAAPGKQPDVIRNMLAQADDFLRQRDLITIPQIERETLRMEMMSPQTQLFTPFFTGGPVISVAYPTSAMTTRRKREAMRGNNQHFAHATVFHEMIPGHNMQTYMSIRFAGYQAALHTPFWLEGWPLYWEMLLYDLGFNETPEDRVGALFWRMHRCARIVFSYKFHLGEWSPQECIDYLVAKVGHERENATAEVRRSFETGYGPLYQSAYMLGGLQIRELRKEFVDSGRMTLKEFHDAVIQGGSKPVALLRLALSSRRLSRDISLEWPCFGSLPERTP